MTKMEKKQRNNHARSKQKRRNLRLKNKMKSVFEKRAAKIVNTNKPKGRTIIGKAKSVAKSVAEMYKGTREYSRMIKGKKRIGNQRQVRKMRRQNPCSKKWAA